MKVVNDLSYTKPKLYLISIRKQNLKSGIKGSFTKGLALLWGLVLSGFIKKLVSLCKGILHASGH